MLISGSRRSSASVNTRWERLSGFLVSSSESFLEFGSADFVSVSLMAQTDASDCALDQCRGRFVRIFNAGLYNGWEQHEHQASEDFIETVVIESLSRELSGD